MSDFVTQMSIKNVKTWTGTLQVEWDAAKQIRDIAGFPRAEGEPASSRT
jgi:hypothetical protein